MGGTRLAVDRRTSDADLRAAVAGWVAEHVPETWQSASIRGRSALRAVRPRADYERWYSTFADSGLVVATWPVEYGGLDLTPDQAQMAESVLEPLNLGRLNPLGLNCVAPPLFAFGTEAQRLRFLPPIVRNEEVWCQLLSEPGAGSDLASLATRAVRDGGEWVITGQKVWTTWAHVSDRAVCLVRTDPTLPKRQGLTYFMIDLKGEGVTVRPLRHIGGEIDFNEVFLDDVRVPDDWRIGSVGEGWRVAGATLAGERQMVSGSGSGGVDRIGGGRASRLPELAARHGRRDDPVLRQRIVKAWSEEKVRGWTNERVRAARQAGQSPGPAASIGKIDQGALNQRIQMLAVDVVSLQSQAWPATAGTAIGPEAWASGMPYETQGMLRSRANTIEGGTSEVNRNIVGEKVLGLPREPDPYTDTPWEEVPRS